MPATSRTWSSPVRRSGAEPTVGPNERASLMPSDWLSTLRTYAGSGAPVWNRSRSLRTTSWPTPLAARYAPRVRLGCPDSMVRVTASRNRRCRAGPAGSRCAPPTGSRRAPAARRRGCCPSVDTEGRRRDLERDRAVVGARRGSSRPGASTPARASTPCRGAIRSCAHGSASATRARTAIARTASTAARVPPGDSGLRSSLGQHGHGVREAEHQRDAQHHVELVQVAQRRQRTRRAPRHRSAAKKPARSPAYPKPTRTSAGQQGQGEEPPVRVVTQRDAHQAERDHRRRVEHQERRRHQLLAGLEVDAGEVGDPVRLPHQACGPGRSGPW